MVGVSSLHTNMSVYGATAEDGGSLLIIFRCAYFMMNFLFELAQVAMRPCKVKDSFV
jgi:hypothetical protein